MATAKQILAIAKKELNYQEKPVNKTKYGAYYNNDGNQWCGMFVNWVFEQAGMKPNAKDGIPNTFYTPSGAAAFKKRGQWFDKGEIKAGDVLYWNFPNDNLDRISHVGIATKDTPANALKVECISGNTGSSDPRNGGAVLIYSWSREWLVGWGRPAYEAETSVAKPAPAKKVSTQATPAKQPANNSKQETYVVQNGDTLWAIAIKYKVTVENLAAANNLKSSLIRKGQKLIIPKSTVSGRLFALRNRKAK